MNSKSSHRVLCIMQGNIDRLQIHSTVTSLKCANVALERCNIGDKKFSLLRIKPGVANRSNIERGNKRPWAAQLDNRWGCIRDEILAQGIDANMRRVLDVLLSVLRRR